MFFLSYLSSCVHDFSSFVYPLTCFSSYLLFPSSLSCCVVYMISSYLSILGHVFLNWVCTVRGLSFRGLYCQWLVFPGFVLSEDCLSGVFFPGFELSVVGLSGVCNAMGLVLPYFLGFVLSEVLSFRGLYCQGFVFPGFELWKDCISGVNHKTLKCFLKYLKIFSLQCKISIFLGLENRTENSASFYQQSFTILSLFIYTSESCGEVCIKTFSNKRFWISFSEL